MVTRDENDLLTRTGPGTPMGEMLRRYWVPVLGSSELEPDGAPVSIQIMSEQLVAFRDSHGRVGLLPQHCPHRGTSLALARNEEDGLRCIYHGWKFDAAGKCVDMPTEPEESTYRDRIGFRGYVTREAGDVVWAYLGPPERIPPFSDFQWTNLPEKRRFAVRVLQECNYMQGMEGGIDPAHVPFLHRGLTDDPSAWGIPMSRISMRNTRVDIETTDYGFRFAAVRERDAATRDVRITPFIAPWYKYVPERADQDTLFHAWVPRDDGSNWAWDVWFNLEGPVDAQGNTERRGLWMDASARKERNRENNWLQDRDAMKTLSFSGIFGIMNQDQAVQESMGPIYDRSQEHLGSSDRVVITMRMLMLDAVKTFTAGGDPPALSPNIAFQEINGEVFELSSNETWQQVSAHRHAALRGAATGA